MNFSKVTTFLLKNIHFYVRQQYKFSTKGKTYTVIMVRHGQSEWNAKNKFTGWFDSGLTARGRKEALQAGKTLKEAGFCCDLAITSVLFRAIETLEIILKVLGQNPEIWYTWRLNERHYGGLTGLDKAETAKKFGEKQVKIWRRSYETAPPAMDEEHPYYDNIVNDPRYKAGPSKDEFPMCESLKLTIQRTLPYWHSCIVPQIKCDRKILIAAHGNSLRGIVKYLDSISEKDILELNLPTGIPFCYVLGENMKPVPDGSLTFMGDPEAVRKAMEEVKAQGKKK